MPAGIVAGINTAFGELSEQVLSVGSSATVPGVTAAGINPRAVAVTPDGALAAAAAASGIGVYNPDTGVYAVEVNIPTLVTYVVTMVGSGGLSLTALLKGWGTKPAS